MSKFEKYLEMAMDHTGNDFIKYRKSVKVDPKYFVQDLINQRNIKEWWKTDIIVPFDEFHSQLVEEMHGGNGGSCGGGPKGEFVVTFFNKGQLDRFTDKILNGPAKRMYNFDGLRLEEHPDEKYRKFVLSGFVTEK